MPIYRIHFIQVTWLKGNALEPSTFYNVLSDVDGVVHTLGTLFEDGAYKRAIREGNPLIALVRLLEARLASENPLRKVEDESYDSVNRDSGSFIYSLPIDCLANVRFSYQSM